MHDETIGIERPPNGVSHKLDKQSKTSPENDLNNINKHVRALKNIKFRNC